MTILIINKSIGALRPTYDKINMIVFAFIIISASSLLAAMDHTADPCQDFFQFACGTWNKKHLIPEDRSSISTFEVR
jgi:hypothetical protein